MPTEEKHQCEFTGHIYKSEAPGSFEKKKKVMFIILVHLNIACIESESLSKPPELMKITTS